MAPKIKLTLNPPTNNEYYTSDDVIAGMVSLSLNKSSSIKCIKVQLKAFMETTTKMDAGSAAVVQNGVLIPLPDSNEYHMTVDSQSRVFPPDNVWNALEGNPKPFKLKPGQYEYNFNLNKWPSTPKCFPNHSSDSLTFFGSKRGIKITSNENLNLNRLKRNVHLPPSFNLNYKDLLKIDNLDLYYYSMGKILYLIEVKVELGKPSNWFKPFDRFVTHIEKIEFIPTYKNLIMDYDYQDLENEKSFLNSNLSSIKIVDLPGLLNEQMLSNEELSNKKIVKQDLYYPYNSLNLPIVFPSVTHLTISKFNVHLQAIGKNLRKNFRNDYFFRKGSNKFDNVSLLLEPMDNGITNLPTNIRDFIKLTKLQINLLENASYLSKNISNENHSSLRLIEIDPKTFPDFNLNGLVDWNSVEIIDTFSKINNKPIKIFKIDIKFWDHPILKKIRFNEENYKHRGNRLYSFRTCTIKRSYQLQMLTDWKCATESHSSLIKNLEIRIPNAQVFVQSKSNIRKNSTNNEVSGKINKEPLPPYVNPPEYAQFSSIASISSNNDVQEFSNGIRK
ncbi:hypothetical protein TBLA_0A08030 [Henningerozyma blattae CBS 6284]|uniref:Arrestin-like N-terminal domain-containing protein n=1 Tax=Henningerozyma blattae (strain ATCC 34711 / CBS 6284 / DSM 70876 / NBRC 10599 / NRRL Y-10934 / UCD 77-7) TaxID=1071380 RepID=I2GWU1_HENB6|nr:hypothetical protein TBLA_0A08030 [Tetrapisispora blattae CBS 6284]CCH58593.1 hypothetical protein TBLA_0A08030 [Tetrapisispora blattae CBS 6284]